MPDISIVRHESVFDANKHKDQKFTIIGAGATGSRVFAGWLISVLPTSMSTTLT